jgi:hypothetical protein
MANALYPKTKAQMLGAINLLPADVRLILVDLGAYTYDAGNAFLSDVPSGARTAVSSSLTGKSMTRPPPHRRRTHGRKRRRRTASRHDDHARRGEPAAQTRPGAQLRARRAPDAGSNCTARI